MRRSLASKSASLIVLIVYGCVLTAAGSTEVPADLPTKATASTRPVLRKAAAAKVVFIGARHSHGPGAHENQAGAALLKKLIDAANNVRGVATVLYRDRLPDDLVQLDEAAALVILCEGWNEHLLNHRDPAVMKKFRELVQRGTGLMCLHSATAVEDDIEKEYTTWTGGNKKLGYSTHPMVDNEELLLAAPDHPICRGVKPMRFAREEFYRRIAFDESAGRITPILRAGPAAAKATDQVVAWAFERRGGGRAFCCTGPHFYATFENDDFRKLLLNAVLWVARREVPQDGVHGAAPARQNAR